MQSITSDAEEELEYLARISGVARNFTGDPSLGKSSDLCARVTADAHSVCSCEDSAFSRNRARCFIVRL